MMKPITPRDDVAFRNPTDWEIFYHLSVTLFLMPLYIVPKGGPNVTTAGFLTASQFASDDCDWLAHLEIFRHETANLYIILVTIG